MTPDDFIRRYTRLQRPPLIPEILLYLADDIMQLWGQLQREMQRDNPAIPFWGCAWVGGQALGRYILDNPNEIRGKRVFDVASGSGLCAIAAMLAGAASVTSSDVDPLATCATRLNAAANNVRVGHINANMSARTAPVADVILAGDVFYEEEMAADFLSCLQQAHELGARVLVGDPGRHFFPRELMSQLAMYDVPTTWEVEGAEKKDTGVYTFREE